MYKAREAKNFSHHSRRALTTNSIGRKKVFLFSPSPQILGRPTFETYMLIFFEDASTTLQIVNYMYIISMVTIGLLINQYLLTRPSRLDGVQFHKPCRSTYCNQSHTIWTVEPFHCFSLLKLTNQLPLILPRLPRKMRKYPHFQEHSFILLKLSNEEHLLL